MFLITCITGRDKKIGKVRTRSEWFDRAAVGRHVVAWSTKCGLKHGLAIFFLYFFLKFFWGYLYHTISIRDLKIELFKVIFHRGQLPCSGLNQHTNVGKMFLLLKLHIDTYLRSFRSYRCHNRRSIAIAAKPSVVTLAVHIGLFQAPRWWWKVVQEKENAKNARGLGRVCTPFFNGLFRYISSLRTADAFPVVASFPPIASANPSGKMISMTWNLLLVVD